MVFIQIIVIKVTVLGLAMGSPALNPSAVVKLALGKVIRSQFDLVHIILLSVKCCSDFFLSNKHW